MKEAADNENEAPKSVAAQSAPPHLTGKPPFFIAGIGASAGGLEALKLFFDHTPPDSGLAYVIVQHLDPTHKSLLSDLLAVHTKMDVKQIRNGVKVKPNCVYVIPPNKDLIISHQKLLLIELPDDRRNRRPIDSFFHSLSEDQKENAIGIVLSGTGTEGTLGLKEIIGGGGMSIVQDPATAQFDGMPLSAINANVADHILSPEKMSKKLLDYIKDKVSENVEETEELSDLHENKFSRLFQIIRMQTGQDFSNYKTNTIARRINKRMAFNKIKSVEGYINFLEKNTAEVRSLHDDFLIGVTSFFRDKEVFKSLEKKVIPYLIEKCTAKQEIRVWVCACSTGEEAYSIAMLLKEALEKNRQYLKVTIFASDIDSASIDFARAGVYADSIVNDISPERLSKFFIKKEKGYQLKKEIREMVVFAHHNLIKDPPFSKLDLITCRNLLIYLKSDLQKKIIPLFHYSLNTDGILVLGTSETIGDFGNLFSPFDEKNKIFKGKNYNIRKSNPVYDLPFVAQKNEIKETDKSVAIKKTTAKMIDDDSALTRNYVPPSVIIDKNNDSLYFSGNTGLYLNHPSGPAKWNILELVKEGFRPDLENAIRKARKNKTEIRKYGIEIKSGDGVHLIDLTVKPLLTREYDSGTLMIVFEPAASPEKTGRNPGPEAGRKQKAKNSELEYELKTTREDLESAFEDLKTSNQDLQSANEELQSTNEELETSREELQSVNEELITVNAELTNKIDQLSQSNNDLNNLLRSIEVATVYLDRDLKIKRFTPAATKIFNLIPTDIDRPVTQLSINLHYQTFADDVKHSLKTLETKSIEVCAFDGSWYNMRIIPYRTSENMIEGVLVTLVDITNQKNVEQKLEKTNKHFNLVMENLPAIVYTCVTKPELEINYIGESCERIMGFIPEQFVANASFWINRIHPDEKKNLITAFSKVAVNGNEEILFRWKCSDGKYKQFVNYMRKVAAENGNDAYIIGVWQEIKGSKFLNEKADSN